MRVSSLATSAGFRLRPPRTPRGLVQRPGVTGALLATDPGSVSVITAAPGYGATTAVQQAVLGSADDVCWVTLDDTLGDAEVRSLVQTAVGASGIDVADVRAALSDAGSTWLVLDGLAPTAHPGFTADLPDLVGNLPASCRVLMTANGPLDLPDARRFDEELLAFAPDDAFDLLNSLVPGIDIDDAADMIQTADGWVSALVLGAQRVASHGTGGQWLREQGPVELLTKWYSGLSQQLRQGLQRTSVLDLLAEGPVACIFGSDAQSRLVEMAASHAYVWPCDPPAGHDGRWWRRHPMLTTFLRQRSDVQSTADHAAVADWFAAHGDVPNAMTHLIASGRFADAADFLTQHESQLLSSGGAPQVLQWYGRLADAQTDRVVVALRNAWGHAMARDIAGADAGLARLRAEMAHAQSAGDADGNHERWEALQAEEALLRAYLACYHGDPATVTDGARRAMAHPQPDHSRDATQLAPVLLVRGLQWSGQSRAAVEAFARIVDEPYPNDVLRNLHLAGARALVLCEAGEVRQAAAALEGIDAWAADRGLDPIAIQLYSPSLARAWVAIDTGDLQAAAHAGEEALRAAEDVGLLCDAVWACILLARCATARGDFGAAMRALTQGRDLATSQVPDSTLLLPIDQTQSLVHTAAGDTVRAERLIRRLPPSEQRSLLSARAGLTRQPVLSRRTLEAIGPATPRVAAERHMLLAGVLARTSRRMAQGHVREAAAIAVEAGMLQLLVPAPPQVIEIANETALEFDDANLNRLLHPSPAQPAALVEVTPATSLSRGELQLLAILPTRARNVEIAERLGVSVNTVKTRLRRLYAKLGAANRDEAIDRAVERGLLTPQPGR